MSIYVWVYESNMMNEAHFITKQNIYISRIFQNKYDKSLKIVQLNCRHTKKNLYSLDLSKIQSIDNAVQFLSPMLSYHLVLF